MRIPRENGQILILINSHAPPPPPPPKRPFTTMWAKLSLKSTMVVNLSGRQMVAGPPYIYIIYIYYIVRCTNLSHLDIKCTFEAGIN